MKNYTPNPPKYHFQDDSMNMKFEVITSPHQNLVIPETWNNVREFAHWWIEAGTPIIFNKNAEVFLSDDATASCLFRKGRFQVELYLIHPKPTVPVHEHPGVEVIKMKLGYDNLSFSNVLRDGESHGSGMKMEAEESGYPLIAFQHWIDKEPNTIASQWKGITVGPKHEALIRRFHPDAYIVNGYADITKTMSV